MKSEEEVMAKHYASYTGPIIIYTYSSRGGFIVQTTERVLRRNVAEVSALLRAMLIERMK